jgi:hypothetical protein
MAYLTKKVDAKTIYKQESGSVDSDFEGTTVGRCVRKQLSWADAQGNWDAVRDEAEGMRVYSDTKTKVY